MGQERVQWRKTIGPPGAVARILAVLFLICLAECASGSCLSYGHSCWGAHGKRSGQIPAVPKLPDWYFMRLLRRVAIPDLNHVRPSETFDIRDINAIFRVDNSEESPNASNLVNNAEDEIAINRHPDAIPMLDDETVAKVNFLQLLRDAAVEK